jgi:hypothetical protein
VIDPTKSVPDREVLNMATQIFSDLLAVEIHRHGQPSTETLERMSKAAYQSAFALLREHQRLVKEESLKGKKEKK